MGKVHVSFKIKLGFYNDYFIGGGKGNGLIDSYVLKDHNKRPYIPASTIKGRTRYNASRLLNNLGGLSFCGFEESKNEAQKNEDNQNCYCDICTLFGASGNKRGILNFDDLKLIEEQQDLGNYYSNRVGIQINRYLKIAEDRAIYNMETSGLSGNLWFEGSIDGYFQKDKYKKYVLLIYIAFKMINSLGGNQSRGLGWISEDSDMEIYVDNVMIEKETIVEWGESIEI